MLVYECLLVFDPATREDLKPARMLLDRSFEHFYAHSDRKNGDKLDGDNNYEAKDQPHDEVTRDKFIILSSLVVQAEVNDHDLDAEGSRLEMVQSIVIERLL